MFASKGGGAGHRCEGVWGSLDLTRKGKMGVLPTGKGQGGGIVIKGVGGISKCDGRAREVHSLRSRNDVGGSEYAEDASPYPPYQLRAT